MVYVISQSGRKIYHPGNFLKSLLRSRKMTQLELAVRTGFSAKHISTVVNGLKRISLDFATKLEFALGKEAGYWVRLQTRYDLTGVRWKNYYAITLNEHFIYRRLTSVIDYGLATGTIECDEDRVQMLLNLKKLLGVSAFASVNLLLKRIKYPKNQIGYTNSLQLLVAIDAFKRNTRGKVRKLSKLKLLDREREEAKINCERTCNYIGAKLNRDVSSQYRAIILKDEEISLRRDRLIRVFPELRHRLERVRTDGFYQVGKFLEKYGVVVVLLPRLERLSIRGIYVIENNLVRIGVVDNEKFDEMFAFDLFYLLASAIYSRYKGYFVDFLVDDPYPNKKALFLAKNKFYNSRKMLTKA